LGPCHPVKPFSFSRGDWSSGCYVQDHLPCETVALGVFAMKQKFLHCTEGKTLAPTIIHDDELDPGRSIESYTAGIRSDLRKIQSRNWWSWSNMLVVVLLLTAAVLSFSIPTLLEGSLDFFQLNLNLAMRGLVALVLLFSVYSLWQQLRIKNLCREIQEKQASAETLYKLAMFDPLTGLYNRRFAEPRIEAEVLRCERKGSSLTLLIMDLDRFKQINDQYGHPAGDVVLRTFADHLRSAIRGTDLAARLGGDEFLLLLPDCDVQQLHRVLARLVNLKVEVSGKTLPISFSAGWHEFERGQSADDLFEAADHALYENKKTSPTRALANALQA
jgi:diguanylate cyclase (GGDEF)-like protein